MSIMPSAKARRPKASVTLNVNTGTQVKVSDYVGQGKAIKYIRNDDTVTSNILEIRVNCMTMTGKPNNGLVDTPVRIYNLEHGATIYLDAGETSPEGMVIESFQVIDSDSGAIDITMW